MLCYDIFTCYCHSVHVVDEVDKEEDGHRDVLASGCMGRPVPSSELHLKASGLLVRFPHQSRSRTVRWETHHALRGSLHHPVLWLNAIWGISKY